MRRLEVLVWYEIMTRVMRSCYSGISLWRYLGNMVDSRPCVDRCKDTLLKVVMLRENSKDDHMKIVGDDS